MSAATVTVPAAATARGLGPGQPLDVGGAGLVGAGPSRRRPAGRTSKRQPQAGQQLAPAGRARGQHQPGDPAPGHPPLTDASASGLGRCRRPRRRASRRGPPPGGGRPGCRGAGVVTRGEAECGVERGQRVVQLGEGAGAMRWRRTRPPDGEAGQVPGQVLAHLRTAAVLADGVDQQPGVVGATVAATLAQGRLGPARAARRRRRPARRRTTADRGRPGPPPRRRTPCARPWRGRRLGGPDVAVAEHRRCAAHRLDELADGAPAGPARVALLGGAGVQGDRRGARRRRRARPASRNVSRSSSRPMRIFTVTGTGPAAGHRGGDHRGEQPRVGPARRRRPRGGSPWGRGTRS